jgi:DNA-binding CsgD family transcriptional regulator
MIGTLLTPREEEIARFVAAGLSDKEIARAASISIGNVEMHLHRCCQKLGVANRAALAGMASSGARPRIEGNHQIFDNRNIGQDGLNTGTLQRPAASHIPKMADGLASREGVGSSQMFGALQHP